MRRIAPLALLLLLAACGGSGDGPERASQGRAVDSLQDLLDGRVGEDVGLVLGTSDFAVGENRISFLVVGSNGQVVEAPRARVYAAPESLARKPITNAPARLLSLDPDDHPAGKSPHAEPDAQALFVTRLRFEKPGRYWLVADLEGRSVQGMSVIDVKPEAKAPAVGSEAPRSDTPTLADGPAEEITTARPPDTELLRYSIKDSIDAEIPFVVVFSTPAFCESRTCGPTVEIVDEVRKRLEGERMRFIHVEVYEDNDPQKGVNRFMKEWKLPTEPWVFVVDSRGIVRARFEGSASVEELEAAARGALEAAG